MDKQEELDRLDELWFELLTTEPMTGEIEERLTDISNEMEDVEYEN